MYAYLYGLMVGCGCHTEPSVTTNLGNTDSDTTAAIGIVVVTSAGPAFPSRTHSSGR